MITNATVLSYFLQAGSVVKIVMLILLMASIASWTLILQRSWYFRRIKQAYKSFHDKFWDCTDLSKLFNDLEGNSDKQVGLSPIFYAGFREFSRQRKQGKITLDAIKRVMDIGQEKEAFRMEQYLPIFATIGSIAPYVGLLGTVWGIMTSFQALGQAQQATIAMVAPGISEALVATALGLFTAIPAVIAFNRFTNNAGNMLDRYGLFQEEFIALISEQTQ